jgi:hypothetical protein
LADIQNTRMIRGVMARGRWFNRAALDALLRDVEQAAGSGCHALPPSPK